MSAGSARRRRRAHRRGRHEHAPTSARRLRSGAVRGIPPVCCYLGREGHPGPCDFDTQTHAIGPGWF